MENSIFKPKSQLVRVKGSTICVNSIDKKNVLINAPYCQI